MALFGVGDGLKILEGDLEASVLIGSTDPSIVGKAAPVGSLYLRSDGKSYKKVGAADTDWAIASAAEGNATGFIFVTNVTNSGNVNKKTYVAGTIPANTVLTSCKSDTTAVTVSFLAEPSSFYSPTVTVDGVTCTNLAQYGDDRRLFTGSVNLTLTCAAGDYQDVVVSSSTGQSTTVRITRASAGPEIQSITFGAYPGTQTHLKLNDTIGVTVKCPNDATAAWIIAGKANKTLLNLTAGALDGAGVGYRNFVGTMTVSSIGTDNPVDAQAENALGTRGSIFTSANLIIDQVYPTITFNSITYPASQSALKNSETADVNVSVTNWTAGTDNITYSTPLSEITIPNLTTYAQIKTVTRVGGTYNVSSNNYAISATKVRNAATSTYARNVQIANVAPQLSITEPYTRLRTRSDGYSNVGLTTASTVAEHTITISSNQVLNAVPTLASPDAGKGTWKNGTWTNAGGMTSFTNVLQLLDSCTRGTHAWGAISGTGLSGLNTTTITGDGNFTIGGFYPRYYGLMLGQNTVSGATEMTTYSKYSLDWRYQDGTGQVKALSRSAVINTAPPVTNEYTAVAVNTNPTTFVIIDTAATQSMTQSTVVLVEEIV